MGGKFSRSWELTKQSWSVLRADKALVLFPLISSVALIAVMATYAIPVFLVLQDSGVFADGAARASHHDPELTNGTKAMLAFIGFAYYFCTFTVMNFFNVALIGAAMERFNGRETGVGVGISIAVRRIPQILLWSLVAATVGMILKAIEERAGLIGKIVIAIVGMAWAIASFFVVPVLAVEGVGPFEALKRSVAVLKKTWGEAALTRIGVNAVFSLAVLLVLLLTVAGSIAVGVGLGSPILAAVISVVGFLVILGLSLISTTLQTILQAALYRYAADDVVPAGFSGSTLRGMFEPKKAKR